MDVVVIGGGVSGLTCAIELARRHSNVTILEKLSVCGKKILVTGNGRCNYWNEDFSNKHFYCSNDDFLSKVNNEDNREMVKAFLASVGIVPFIKNGYYYPLSKEASSVRNALIFELEELGVKFFNDANVNKISSDGSKFTVFYNDKVIVCDKVVMATGSYAYYNDKTNGYDICKSFGHSINNVTPSLVQLVDSSKTFKECQGVRVNSRLSLYIDGVLEKEEEGELMLTDYGISGICTFNVSGYASRALSKNKIVNVVIDFLPSIDNLLNFLEERNRQIGKRKIDEFLEGLLNYKLVLLILKKAHIDKDKLWDALSLREKNILCEYIKKFEISIVSTKSFNNAQVCTGGVNVDEVNPLSFESKKKCGLYIIGELLDVDGECGGFNLGFAFLSGLIAGRSVESD